MQYNFSNVTSNVMQYILKVIVNSMHEIIQNICFCFSVIADTSAWNLATAMAKA